MKEVKAILSDLTFGLAGLDEGDLMALSALTDQCESLVKLLEEDPLVGSAVQYLSHLFSASLSGEISVFPLKQVSLGVELLDQWRESKEQNGVPPETWVQAVKEWMPSSEEPQKQTAIQTSEPLSIFLSEAHERLTEAQALILDLEANPEEKTAVDVLFRTFHTIKGECGFLKITTLGELAHNVENLLDLLRSKTLILDEEVIDALFSALDQAQFMLDGLLRGELLTPPDFSSLLAKIHDKTSAIRKPIGDILRDSGKLTESDVDAILTKQKDMDFTKKFGEIAAEESLVTTEEISDVVQHQQDGVGAIQRDPLIKVKASQVNYLVDMIGELLIVENQLDEREKNVIQLKKISRGIQNAAMQLRTVKVKNLFINLKRITRDAAKQVGKPILVDIRGDDLEIDRNLVEILEEPMMHLVRNSVGHGIEEVNRRKAAGKSETGNILLQARRQGNSIVISVRDDGGGLNEEKILETAIAKGLIAAERRNHVTRNDIYNFIFLPGFSTHSTVDAISGRGVGMDIVKSTVTAARGKVEIKSEPGQYSEFSLVFPLSLAIIDGMIVVSGKNHYIIPIASIVESLKVDSSQLQTVGGRAKVIDLREEIIPVIFLEEFFRGSVPPDWEGFAIVIEDNQRKIAVMVDHIVQKKEVVIKSLGKKFKHLPAISSAAVLPGGVIGFVINIEEIVQG